MAQAARDCQLRDCRAVGCHRVNDRAAASFAVDGEYRWFLFRAVPIHNQAGNLIKWYGTNTDIEDLKRAEAALRASESNLRLLVDAIPGMVGVNSAAGQNEYCSQQLLDYTGKTVEEMAEFGWASVFHPEDIERVLRTWFQAIATGHPYETEFRMRRWDGVYRWFQTRAEPLRDPEGRILRWYSLIQDIDDRKNAEEALQKVQTELAHVSRVTTLGEMAASIAHEIKQPLAAIVTNGSACLRWLARATPDLDEARETVRRVIRDGNRASEVITRIRALLQKTESEKTRLNVNEAIREVILLAQNEAARKSVTLRTELAANLPPVWGDRVQIQQVLLNLLINGIEAMAAVSDRPREIMVSSRPHESSQVLISAQDSGEGIKRENVEKIFDAFYTTKSQGMGMGLAISRSIAENHGGRLWVVSNDSQGTTFQFTLLQYGSTAESTTG